jgi:fructose-bisphosphate aldolase, class II
VVIGAQVRRIPTPARPGRLVAAIAAGLTKINIATQLNKVFTAAIRRYLAAEPAVVDPRRYGSAGRDAIAQEVARLLALIGAGGRHEGSRR